MKVGSGRLDFTLSALQKSGLSYSKVTLLPLVNRYHPNAELGIPLVRWVVSQFIAEGAG